MKPITVGTYRMRNGEIVDVRRIGQLAASGSTRNTGERMTWDKDNGLFSANPTNWDLVERIDTDLPPALNSAVKAAEDRVRELRQMVDETQTAWATACRLYDAAQKELERLEKECEQPIANAAQVGDHGQGFMPALKEDKAHQ